MYCTKCGQLNREADASCTRCGEPVYEKTVTIADHLVPAIVVLLTCFLPFGIIALMYSLQVRERLKAGDADGASEASKKASFWCWLSFATAFILVFVIGVLAFLKALVETMK